MNLVPALLAAALVALPVVPAGADMEAIECEITDASLTWGFKESFRAYIDGDIANGAWATEGDVSYDTPAFTWTGGTGTYTPIGGHIDIAFTGSVRFTGHDGVLDTTIANPVVRFDAGTGELLLDVSGPTMQGTLVDLQHVRFVEASLVAVVGGDAVRTVDADTALTADGETAFPNYEAGTVFDPISISMTVGKACPTAAEVDVDEHDDGNPALMGPLAGGIALAVVLGVGIFVATRRRRA